METLPFHRWRSPPCPQSDLPRTHRRQMTPTSLTRGGPRAALLALVPSLKSSWLVRRSFHSKLQSWSPGDELPSLHLSSHSSWCLACPWQPAAVSSWYIGTSFPVCHKPCSGAVSRSSIHPSRTARTWLIRPHHPPWPWHVAPLGWAYVPQTPSFPC